MDNQPEEKKEIPTPPPSKVNVRTMQSDIKSMEESGGQTPQPYLTEINQQPQKETPAAEEISFQAPAELESNIPGYVGPEEPIFQPGAPAPLPPEKGTGPAGEKAKPPKKELKTLMTILGVLVLTGILGVGVYYLTSKLIKGKETTPPPPAVGEETVTPAPEITPEPAEYVSLFKTPNALREEKTISALTLENIKNTLIVSASTTPVDSLKELILRGGDQSLISFSGFISVLLPDLKSEEIAGVFGENFTAVVFVDKNGFWPGYVAQLKPTATLIQTQALIKENIESSTNLKNLFLGEPGSTTVAFKDGLAGSPAINTRYSIFSKPGAALNYGWVNNNLVVSTSYSGLSEILKKLQ